MIHSIILQFGCPKKFKTDNGSNFIIGGETIKVICKRWLNICKIETSMEAPSIDGLVERMNRSVKASLSIYCKNNSETWDLFLPFITFAINTSKLASMEYSPFQAMFGRTNVVLPALNNMPGLKFKTYSTEQRWYAYLSHYIPILHQNTKQNI